MSKVLVSACLLGQPVRYDGLAKPFQSHILTFLTEQQLIIPFCPECAGGLAVPRPAAELQSDGLLKTAEGVDVTAAFRQGAELALAMCQRHKIKLAILKESSPSCGVNWIYDGNFNRHKIQGAGLTTRLLQQHGIQVYSEVDLASMSVKQWRLLMDKNGDAAEIESQV